MRSWIPSLENSNIDLEGNKQGDAIGLLRAIGERPIKKGKDVMWFSLI